MSTTAINAPDARVLCDIRNAADDLPMMIVGAGARRLTFDLPLNLTHGRATTDWDIGVQLHSWEAFKTFRERACATGGFRETPVPHRLVHHPTGIPLDIIPFGAIAEKDTIYWPGAETLMNVAGFEEALQFARNILVTPDVEVKVITPEMLAVLKCFAFVDRGNQTSRDLRDLLLLAEYYSPESGEDRLFEAPFDALIQIESFDSRFAPALLLGHDMAAHCRKLTRRKLLPILESLCVKDSDLLFSLSSTPGRQDQSELKRSLYFNLFFWLATGAKSVGKPPS